jgi:hypothetical protein
MTGKRKDYYSGYISLDHLLPIELPYKGKFFEVDFIESDRSSSTKISFGGETQCAKEAVISTGNIENAEKASRSILAALDLVVGHCQFEEIPEIIPSLENEAALRKSRSFECKSSYPMGIGCSNIPWASIIACRASFKRAYYYALSKYRLGCWLHSNSIMDLEPDMPAAKLSLFPDDHIRMAYAIILFYSIIEELDIEIRASKKNPSIIDGKWNPKVKDEWERRATKIGIDVNNPISWTFRGTPTKIERKKRPRIISKSKWAGGSIRDSEISLIDAINQISFIRSKIASHKVSKGNDATSSISIYDVANANFLARRVLLEKFGYWNWYRKLYLKSD